MTRSVVVGLFLLVVPLAAAAHDAGKIRQVGFLWDRPTVWPHALEGFRQGLRDLGWVEGKTVEIKYRWAVVLSTPLFLGRAKLLADLAMKHKIPTMFGPRQHAAAGGFLSFGPDRADLYRRAAAYVDKILRGAKPADLPVQQATSFKLVVNLKTAKALGITIPQSILLRADEVIE